MTTFGELIEESSRAFPDDEDEMNPDWAPEMVYEESSDDSKAPGVPYTLILFHGKLAVGFGEGFLSKSNHFTHVASLSFATGDPTEGIADSMLKRKPGNSRPVLRFFKSNEHGVVFGFVDTYGMPRSLANQIVQEEHVTTWVQGAGKVLIFHSEINATYRGTGDGKLYYLKTTVSPVAKGLSLLPQPNLVSGVSAAVLTICEALDKPCILLVNYSETELVDSLSIEPFLRYTKGWTDIGNLVHSLQISSKTNITHVTESTNLYT